MIEGRRFTEKIKEYFGFLSVEFGFKLLGEEIRGNAFYDVQYRDTDKVISISYENIEDYLLVIISVLQNGELPDFDDKTKTLHLSKLNSVVLSKVDRNEINLNNEFFSKFEAKDDLEKRLLKSARELRMCLKHFSELQVGN